MFERLRGRHFPSEIPAIKKNRKAKNVLSIIRKIFTMKVDINVEIVTKKPGLCPVPCFMLHHTVIDYRQYKTHILAI